MVGDFEVWFGRRRELIFELEFEVSHFAIAFEGIDLIHDFGFERKNGIDACLFC